MLTACLLETFPHCKGILEGSFGGKEAPFEFENIFLQVDCKDVKAFSRLGHLNFLQLVSITRFPYRLKQCPGSPCSKAKVCWCLTLAAGAEQTDCSG